MKKKLSLTEKISLAENNAVDFMHACVTIALHDEYEVGVQRLRKVNLRRGENADTLAEKIGIRAGEVRRWMGENGMLRISGARMQQLAAALDGGVLITEDGAEFELYRNGENR